MVNPAHNHASIVRRAVAAYEGLMALYAPDAPDSPYFTQCLAEARTQRNGLQERLDDPNPASLAYVFKDNFYHSIDHFFESHRGEYGPDMPNPNPAKATTAARWLQELLAVIDDIIGVKRAQRLDVV